MDLQTLCGVLQACVNPDKTLRKAAEAELQRFRYTPGHATSLLQCLVAPELALPLRQAAAVEFKNLCLREWSPEEADEASAAAAGRVLTAPADPAAAPLQRGLPDADKAVVRANLLEAIIQSPQLLRAQLGVVLRVSVDADFPDRWPELAPALGAALASTDVARIYGGLFTLRALSRKYEFRTPTERATLHALLADTFPTVLRVVQGLLAMNSLALEVADLLKLALKTLWSATYMDIPPLLHDPQTFHAWMTALGAIIELPLPAEAQPADAEEREAWPWWKTKKWAFHICNRFFSRYSNPKVAPPGPQKAFALRFKANYACPLLQAYLRVLATLPSGGYLPPRVVKNAVQLLEYAVPKPAPYRLLAAALPELLPHVIFPLLCFSDADAELWESDPHEYIRKGYDCFEDMYHPRNAAQSFVAELMRVRKDQLPRFVAFLVSVLQRCGPGVPAEQRPARQLDGALTALGSLVSVLKRTPPYGTQLEAMLVAHVLPEFANPAGHVRAKAAWVAGQYADITFRDAANFGALFQRVMAALSDPELPVRVDAVVALRAFIEEADDAALEGLRAVMPQLLNVLFGLMAEVDNEDLVCTLEAVVERFGSEMAPYAHGLVASLVASFERSQRARDGAGDDDGDEDEASALACMGCLRAVSTILDAVSGKPALFPALEAQLLPLLQRLLNEDGEDVYEELLDIVGYLSFYGPGISEGMWSLFPVLISNTANWAVDYFELTLMSLDNYISRDRERFLRGTDARGVPHPDAVFSLAAAILSDADYEDSDCVPAAQLLAVVLQHCRGAVDAWLLPYIQLAASRLAGERPATSAFLRDVLLLLWAHALIYDARAALAAAEGAGVLPLLLSAWTTALGARRKDGKRAHFRRENDKKVCALALGAMLLLPPEQAPPLVRPAGPALATAALALLSELRTQRTDRLRDEAEEAALERGDGAPPEDDDDDSLDGATLQLQEEEDDDDNAGGGADGAQPAAWGGRRSWPPGGDDDDSWSDFTEDDDGDEGPLDHIDPWIFMVDGLAGLAQTDPARFGALTAALDPATVRMLQETEAFATQRRAEIAAERAEQAAQAAQAGVPT